MGLTQNPSLIGNWAALGWGLLGVFIKGGIWIGLAGAFLGMGTGGKHYRAIEGFALLLAMLVVGIWLLNRPFDPEHRILPRIYFSADWCWEPAAQLKPRPECWGGLLLAWLGLTSYLWAVRRDRVAAGMAVAGFLAGGIGFTLGQSLQAAHAWSPHWFRWGPLAQLEPHVNWWNMMEITFGATFAGLLAVALWLRARFSRDLSSDQLAMSDEVTLSPAWEAVLIASYVSFVLEPQLRLLPFPLAVAVLDGENSLCVDLHGVRGGPDMDRDAESKPSGEIGDYGQSPTLKRASRSRESTHLQPVSGVAIAVWVLTLPAPSIHAHRIEREPSFPLQ